MDRLQAIYTELTACQDCYKCLRECPVKAIQISDGHAKVMRELCIHCGHCVEICPQKAKKVRSDLDRARILVRIRPKAVLSLAPSFAAEFPGVPAGKLIAGLRALGFCAVSETSFGADLVSAAVSAGVSAGMPRVAISSACPSAVQYIHKYLPSLSPYVTDVCSPMVAHGRYLKRLLGPETAVIFAGPCIAKKNEAEASEGAVDVALTFGELRAWLEEAEIDLQTAVPDPEDRFYPERSSHGAYYPVEGGMIASLKHAGLTRAHCMTFTGIRQIREALLGLDIWASSAGGGELPADAPSTIADAARQRDKTLFIELLACEGGCINGPQSISRGGTAFKRLQVLEYAGESAARRAEEGAAARHADAGAGGAGGALAMGQPAALAEAPIVDGAVPPDQLRAALASIGKYGHADELNCSGCGYDSCRAFASAVVLGKAEKTMCVSYMRNLAQKKANALMRTMPSAAVVVDASLRVVESNKPFAELLGEDAAEIFEIKPSLENADIRKLVPFWQAFEDILSQAQADSLTSDFCLGDKVIHGTIFSIEKGLLAGGLFQDVTVPWIQKDRVIQQAKSVMTKNLKTVQKIAYLLGENAAESEAALTSIIDSFQGGGTRPNGAEAREAEPRKVQAGGKRP
jgi:iron only hydrogenase large subunit-like protein